MRYAGTQLLARVVLGLTMTIAIPSCFGCALAANRAEESTSQALAPVDDSLADEKLLTALVRAEDVVERVEIAMVLAQRHASAGRESRYAVIREFTRAAAHRSATSAIDTAGDIRSRQAVRILVPALGLDGADAIAAMMPIYSDSLDPTLTTTASMLLTALGAYEVRRRTPDLELEFPGIAEAVISGRLPGPSPQLLKGSFVTSMFAVHPEAAVNTWLRVDQENTPRHPMARARLMQKVHRMEYLRQLVETSDLLRDQETLTAATREGLDLLTEMVDLNAWPVQYYVYSVLLSSNRFDDPRIAARLRQKAGPMLQFLRERDLASILFPAQVAPGVLAPDEP